MRKLLLTLMVVGAVGSTVGAGTFASFSAQTNNDGAVIQTGSILLSNQKTGVDGVYATYNTCFSNTSGNTTTNNTNGSCDQLINVEVKKPGDVAYADLTLQNLGSLGGVLKVKASQVCATSAASGQSYNGGGDACVGNRLTIQRFSSIANRNANVTTGGQCFYGGGAGGQACSFNSTYTIDHFSDTYPVDDSTPALTLGSMPAGGLYLLRVAIQLPSGASNNLQGRQANFGFTWTLEQA